MCSRISFVFASLIENEVFDGFLPLLPPFLIAMLAVGSAAPLWRLFCRLLLLLLSIFRNFARGLYSSLASSISSVSFCPAFPKSIVIDGCILTIVYDTCLTKRRTNVYTFQK